MSKIRPNTPIDSTRLEQLDVYLTQQERGWMLPDSAEANALKKRNIELARPLLMNELCDLDYVCDHLPLDLPPKAVHLLFLLPLTRINYLVVGVGFRSQHQFVDVNLREEMTIYQLEGHIKKENANDPLFTKVEWSRLHLFVARRGGQRLLPDSMEAKRLKEGDNSAAQELLADEIDPFDRIDGYFPSSIPSQAIHLLVALPFRRVNYVIAGVGYRSPVQHVDVHELTKIQDLKVHIKENNSSDSAFKAVESYKLRLVLGQQGGSKWLMPESSESPLIKGDIEPIREIVERGEINVLDFVGRYIPLNLPARAIHFIVICPDLPITHTLSN